MRKNKVAFAVAAIACTTALAVTMAGCAKKEHEDGGQSDYTVTFDANGGAFLSGDTVSIVVDNGAFATPPGDPTRTDYIFYGWLANETDIMPVDISSTAITADTTFYAGWRAAVDITYDYNYEKAPNGGVYTSDSVAVGSLLRRPDDPTRDGDFTFLGWAIDEAGYSMWNFSTDKAMNAVTLYAKWHESEVQTVQVTFDANIDGYTVVAPLAQNVRVGRTAEQPTLPALKGFTFGGWYDNSACAGESFDFGTAVTEAVTLYAKWTANTYNITYTLNGGQNGDNAMTYTATNGVFGTMPLTAPTKPHYTGKWQYKGEDITALTYEKLPETETNIELVAVYAGNTYSVDYTLGDHLAWMGGDVPSGYDSYVYGDGLALPTRSDVEANRGYAFRGWYVDGDADRHTITDISNTLAPQTGDTLKLVAVVEQVETVTVTLDPNYGNLDGETHEVENGTAFDEPRNKPVRKGYRFIEWRTTTGAKYDFSQTVDTNLTLKAYWQIISYTVEYMPSDSTSNPNAATYTVTSGINGEVTLKDATKTHYTFEGWYTSDNYDEQTKVTKLTPDLVPTDGETITLYAKFEHVERTVTFDYNKDGKGAYKTVKVNDGEVASAPDTNPALDNFIFDGWYADAECNVPFDFANTVIESDGVTVYAKWTEDPLTVGNYYLIGSFNDDGSAGDMSAYVATVTSGGGKTTYRVRDVNLSVGDTFIFAKYGGVDGDGARKFSNLSAVSQFTYNPQSAGLNLLTVTKSDGVYKVTKVDEKAVALRWTVSHTAGDNINFMVNGERRDPKTGAHSDALKSDTVVNGRIYIRGSFTGLFDASNSWSDNNAELVTKSGNVYTFNRIYLKPYDSFAVVVGGIGGNDKWYRYNEYDVKLAPSGSSVIQKSSITSDTDLNIVLSGITAGWYDVIFNNSTHKIAIVEHQNILSFNANTALNDKVSGMPSIQYVSEGAAASVPASPALKGYTFGGWYTEDQCETEFDFASGITGATTVYAKWVANTYAVKYDVKGGDAMSDGVFTADTDLTLATPTRDGFDFVGWYLGDVSLYDTDSDSYILTYDAVYAYIPDGASGDITLTAKWQARKYFVAYDGNEPNDMPSVLQGTTAVLDSAVQTEFDCGYPLSEPTDPTLTGYRFVGWYKESACETAWDFSNDNMPANGVTLYAKWELEEYSLSFELNIPSGVDENDIANIPQTVTGLHYGDALTKPATSCPDYKISWYDRADLQGAAFDFNSEYVTGDLTLYALWEDNSTSPVTSINASATKTEYTWAPDLQLDMGTISVVASLENGNTRRLDQSEYTVSVDLTTGGAKTVTVTLKSDTTKQTTFEIAVISVITSIEFVNGEKTPYNVGDAFTAAGYTFYAQYDGRTGTTDFEIDINDFIFTSESFANGVFALASADTTVDDITAEYDGMTVSGLTASVNAAPENTVEMNEYGVYLTGTIGGLVTGFDNGIELSESGTTTTPELVLFYLTKGDKVKLRLGTNDASGSTTGTKYGDANALSTSGGYWTVNRTGYYSFYVTVDSAVMPTKVLGNGITYSPMFTVEFKGNKSVSFIVNRFRSTSYNVDSLYLYMWRDDNYNLSGAWPGKKIAVNGNADNSEYILKLPTKSIADAKYMIFHTNSGIQSGDTSISFTDGMIYSIEVTADKTKAMSVAPYAHTVGFDANIGEHTGDITGMPDRQTVVVGKAPTEPTAPALFGYTFGGWYTDEQCETPFDFTAELTQNATAYAKWTPNRYTVVLNLIGGTMADGEYPTEYVYDTTVTLGNPTRDGYTFVGWFTSGESAEGEEQITELNASLIDGSADGITLWARWDEAVS